jgi:hypothetical protein
VWGEERASRRGKSLGSGGSGGDWRRERRVLGLEVRDAPNGWGPLVSRKKIRNEGKGGGVTGCWAAGPARWLGL